MKCSCLIAASLLIAGVLHAEEPVRVTLVSEVQSIQPGQPFYVGLALHHGEGYHTYWQCPGIVGVPTSIDWKLPPGFSAGDIEWPEPERVFMHDIKAQGFERDVLLPIRITPPASLTNGTIVRLVGRSGWMACARQCHPGFTDVALDLPVRDEPPERDARTAAAFDAERGRVAKASPAWQATARRNGETVILSLVPTAEARVSSDATATNRIVFFTTDNWIHSDLPQEIRQDARGELVITLRINDVFPGEKPPERLHGIVQNPTGWLQKGEMRSLVVNPIVEQR